MSYVHTARMKRYTETKTRKRDSSRREVAARAARFQQPSPPILVRLNRDLGPIPANILIQFPREFAESLILRRLAVPVGDFQLQPELYLDQCDLLNDGLPSGLYWLEEEEAAA